MRFIKSHPIFVLKIWYFEVIVLISKIFRCNNRIMYLLKFAAAYPSKRPNFFKIYLFIYLFARCRKRLFFFGPPQCEHFDCRCYFRCFFSLFFSMCFHRFSVLFSFLACITRSPVQNECNQHAIWYENVSFSQVRMAQNYLRIFDLLLLLFLSDFVLGQKVQWESSNYPNPTTGDWQRCNMRSKSLLCDPDAVLSESERYRVNYELNQLESSTRQVRICDILSAKGGWFQQINSNIVMSFEGTWPGFLWA